MGQSGDRPDVPGTWLVRRIAVLVPWSRRDAWRAEWEGELAWASERGGTWTGTALRLRALASLRDALWLRHRHGRQAVFAQDLRHAVRSLAKRPGYTLSVVLTLGLAIGAATAVFSVVDAVLLRPLAYEDPEALVDVWRGLPSGVSVPAVQPEVLDRWRESGLFTGLEPYDPEGVIVTGVGEPREEKATLMSAGVLPLLGVSPMRGRAFTHEEVASGARVALVSENFWRTVLGGEERLSGLSVRLDDEAYDVIGVMPRTFRFPLGGHAFWLPMEPGIEYMPAIARLRPGVTLEAALERSEALAAQMDAEGAREGGWGIAIHSMDQRSRSRANDRSPLLLALAVLAVVLVGCANAANLLLVHGASRTRELTIRGALGATRARLMRLLMAECAVLSVLAVAAGCAVAVAGVTIFRAIAPSSYAIFGRGEFLLDWRVLGFACTLGTATGLLFGVGPALVSSRRRVPLTGVERAGTATRGMRRTRALLAAGELAIAMTLLVTASLLIRSFGREVGQDVGIDRSGLVVLDVATPDHRYPDAAAKIAFKHQLRDRIATLPGVRGVTLADGLPPSAGFSIGLTLQAEGEAAPESQPFLMPVNGVDESFFEVLGIPIIAGRSFDARDQPGTTPVAIIDTDVAGLLWPDATPGAVVGRRFRLDEDDEEWLTVVGVVGDVTLMGFDAGMQEACDGGPCRYEAYRPMAQRPRNLNHEIAIRTSGQPGLAVAVRSVVHDVDDSVPIRSFASMEQRMLEELDAPRFVLRLVTVFTLIAVGLAALGVYAVLAYSVAQRTREFGVRVALGASSRDVMRDVLRNAALYATVGIVTGGIVALITGRILRSVLFEVSPTDPASLAFAALSLAVVALAASLLPARRATRVSPLDALRTE